MTDAEKEIYRVLQSVAKKSESTGNDIGKMIASGIGVGIDENSYLAITSMQNVYVELDSFTKDAQKNAERLAKKRQERELKNLKNSKDLELISEREYYEKLRDYRDKNLRQGSDEWYKYTEEIIKYNKELAEKAQKEQEKAAKEAAKKCAEMLARVQKLREELRSDLTNDRDPWYSQSKTIIKGIGTAGRDVVYENSELSNFEKQTKLLERYGEAVKKLSAMGNIPDGVLSEIGKMGAEEGLRAANIILNASEEERKKFIDGYNRYEGLTDSLVNTLNPIVNKRELEAIGAGSAEAFNSAYFSRDSGGNTEFINELLESFDTVPENYYKLGGESADSFERGFFEKLPELAERIRSTLLSSMSHLGEEMAAAVLSRSAAQSTNGGNTYNNTYTFNSSAETTTQQLFAAKRAAMLDKLRDKIITVKASRSAI